MRCEHPRPARAEHRGMQVLACLDCCEVSFRDQRGEASPLTALTATDLNFYAPFRTSPRRRPGNVTPGGDNGDMRCEHPRPIQTEHRGMHILACLDCCEVSFRDQQGEMSPLTALTELFGEYDLAATLPVIGIPARQALAYAAPHPAAKDALRTIPSRRWLRAADDLWMRRDGNYILFAHNSPTASQMVGAYGRISNLALARALDLTLLSDQPRAADRGNVTPGGDNGGMRCKHPRPDQAEHRGMQVLACLDCCEVSFRDQRGALSPLTALTELFGEFDLAGALPVIGIPAQQALAYAAPHPAAKEALRTIPSRRWLRADDDLWMRRDGNYILFAHNSPTASRLVGA